MRPLFLIGLSVSLLFVVGCSTLGRSVTYNATIDSVERPEDAARRYGDYTVSETDSSYVYEDDLVRASFVTGGSSLFATIENKTKYSIQVRLEQGAFVMPEGSSQRILTGDMSYAARNQNVQPITVPSGASATSVLVPQSSVSMGSYGPIVSSMFQPETIGGSGNDTATAEDVRQNIGKTFSLLLPIEIQGNINEYTFGFKVVGAKIASGQNKPEKIIGDYFGQ